MFLGGAQNHEQEKNTQGLRGPNSCFKASKSMREPTPELNGSLKDRKSVLKF